MDHWKFGSGRAKQLAFAMIDMIIMNNFGNSVNTL